MYRLESVSGRMFLVLGQSSLLSEHLVFQVKHKIEKMSPKGSLGLFPCMNLAVLCLMHYCSFPGSVAIDSSEGFLHASQMCAWSAHWKLFRNLKQFFLQSSFKCFLDNVDSRYLVT